MLYLTLPLYLGMDPKLRKELSLSIILKLNIVEKITVKHYLNVDKKRRAK